MHNIKVVILAILNVFTVLCGHHLQHTSTSPDWTCPHEHQLCISWLSTYHSFCPHECDGFGDLLICPSACLWWLWVILPLGHCERTAVDGGCVWPVFWILALWGQCPEATVQEHVAILGLFPSFEEMSVFNSGRPLHMPHSQSVLALNASPPRIYFPFSYLLVCSS